MKNQAIDVSAFCGLLLMLSAMPLGAVVVATGGTVTNYVENGLVYVSHRFTEVGESNLVVASGGEVEILVVAGGGGGGGGAMSGGGGAGGLIYTNGYHLEPGEHAVWVGGGGLGGYAYDLPEQAGVNGGDSSFGTHLLAVGGGGGCGWTGHPSKSGGSGGGGNSQLPASPGTLGQGYAGNTGSSASGQRSGGGGGGAGEPGGAGIAGAGGKGGDGREVFGRHYAGGGGGGLEGTPLDAGGGGAGGLGGGGAGSKGTTKAMDAEPNTGGGGGGTGHNTSGTGRMGGSGGSGVVIIRYLLLDAEKATVANGPATNLTTTSAWLCGNLVSTGASATAVMAYWGTADGGTNAASWTSSAMLVAPQVPGGFSIQATELSADATYYYRVAASNDAGVAWSYSGGNFITGELTLTNTSNAAEATLTPGVFTVSRPGTATNEALTVLYEQTGGTAIPGVDYAPLPESVTIPAGEAEATITVTPLKNYDLNLDTTLELTLTGADAVIGASGSATMTIANFSLLQDVYVSPSGDGTDGKTWATALVSLQPAVDIVAEGGTVHVAEGRYDVVSRVEILNKSVAILGGYLAGTPEPGARTGNPAATVFDGGVVSRIFFVTNCPNLVIEGLTIRNGFVDVKNIGGGGAYLENSTAVFRNCVVRDNRVTGSESKGMGFYINAGDVTFDRCTLRDNIGISGGSQYGGAVWQSNGRLSMLDCVVFGNFLPYNAGVVVAEAGTGTTVFSNCLFHANAASGGWAVLQSGRTKTIVSNCTIAENVGGGISRSAGALLVTNSIVWNNGDDIAGYSVTLSHSCIEDPDEGTGVIHDDPQFEEYYRLSATSPCIDKGGATAAEAGMAGRYAQVDAPDSGIVDLGYHAAGAFSPEPEALYVDPVNGADVNDGEAPGVGRALRTLAHALALADTGTRVHLAPGTYNQASGEVFPIQMISPYLLLLGEDAATTIFDAAGSGTRVADIADLARTSVIGEMTFRGGVSPVSYSKGSGLYLRNTMARFDGVVVRDNQLTRGESRGAGVYIDSCAPSFIDCSITNNRHTTGTTYGGGVHASGSPRFVRCVISGNSASYNGGGIAFGGLSLDVQNTLVAGNTAGQSGRGDGVEVNAGAARLLNTTVAGNAGIGLLWTKGTLFVTNSILWGNGIDCTGASANLAYSCVSNGVGFVDGGHNITAAMLPFPPFVAEAAGDYRLADGSPCIDAGFYQPWMRDTTDLAGLRRVMAGGVDMGAYEWEPPAATLLIIQ